MYKHYRSIIFLILGIFLVGIFGFVTQHANAFSTPVPGAVESKQYQSSDLAQVKSNILLASDSSEPSIAPPPATDPCLHCHITGENKGLWTPLARWTLLGTMGLVFVLGVYRSASVWKNKTQWYCL